ncbi:hypothetical protein BDI4_220012 [Burkholderia diffusa]|nr:hypothetical protein BDI4_220012 [Burkholderia diffusa]
MAHKHGLVNRADKLVTPDVAYRMIVNKKEIICLMNCLTF